MRFDGWILGVGTSSGTRVVVGHWPRSPFGPLSDVMVEHPDGHRLLLVPQPEVADFIAVTYTFDEVALVPVAVGRPEPETWTVTAGALALQARTGGRPPLGWLLHALPAWLATAPAWADLVDLPARLAGMRTRGTAGNGRTEWYGVRDLHTVIDLTATWSGTPLGRSPRSDRRSPSASPPSPRPRPSPAWPPRSPSPIDRVLEVTTGTSRSYRLSNFDRAGLLGAPVTRGPVTA